MTATWNQREARAQLAAESVYQRAAAAWVAQREGRDPATVYAVDFAYDPGGSCGNGTCHFEGGALLRYRTLPNGIERELPLEGVAPGEFVAQCVELMST